VWIEIPGEKHGLEHGKLLFELRGYKLRGLWTLVHTPKAGDNHWLLIKERDGFLDDRGTDVYPPDSIFSGLTVDELPDPSVKAKRLVERARKAGAKPGPVVAKELEVMKAVPLDAPVSREGWVFEIKYDGYRLLGDRGEDRGGGGGGSDGVSLWSRAGNDLTATFPEIARAVRGLPFPARSWTGRWWCTTPRGSLPSRTCRSGVGCSAPPTSPGPPWPSPPPTTSSTCWPSAAWTSAPSPCWSGRRC
jgi:bifunctional non-homologous end joining protein LigD